MVCIKSKFDGNKLMKISDRPGMRAYLISQQDTLHYDEFSAAYRGALTVSWPYPTGDILISCPPQFCCNKIRINPVFDHHLMDLGVWKVKDTFIKRFPELQEAMEF